MSVTIKTADEIAKMRVAGRLAAEVLEMIEEHVVPGVTTEELDRRCHDFIIQKQQAIPAPLNYRGFPRSICTSVNHQVCHGIPTDKQLKKGDILNIDITVIKDGYHGDTSKMFCLGEPSILARRLVNVTREALWIGLAQVRPGATLGDIGHAIQSHVESHRFSVVEEYCGHGIGRDFHEEPQVLHYGKRGRGSGAARRHVLHHRAHGQRRQTLHQAAAGRLDGRHQGSRPLGPVGTHRPGHPRWPRGPDTAPGGTRGKPSQP